MFWEDGSAVCIAVQLEDSKQASRLPKKAGGVVLLAKTHDFFVPVPVTVPAVYSGFSHGCPCVLLWRSVSCCYHNRMLVLASCCVLYRGASHR